MPLFFGLLGIVFYIYGITRRNNSGAVLSIIQKYFFVILFGLIVLGGSIYAREVNGVQETFLQLALATLGFLLAILFYWSVENRFSLVERTLWLLALSIPYVATWVVLKRIEDGQAFHTEIFLFIPLMVFFSLRVKSKLIAFIFFISLITLGVLTKKNTGYLVTLISSVYVMILFFDKTLSALSRVKKMFLVFIAFSVFLILLAVVGFLLVYREDYLPSGSAHVRMDAYRTMWAMFLSSPIYGQLFSETTLVQLGTNAVFGQNKVITHSDALDILAHGGVIGFIIFSIAVGKPVFHAYKLLKIMSPSRTSAYIHGLVAIVICGLVTALFNSPLLTFPIAVIFWFCLGLLCCILEDIRIQLRSSNFISNSR